jgi:hypothetical protein
MLCTSAGVNTALEECDNQHGTIAQSNSVSEDLNEGLLTGVVREGTHTRSPSRTELIRPAKTGNELDNELPLLRLAKIEHLEPKPNPADPTPRTEGGDYLTLDDEVPIAPVSHLDILPVQKSNFTLDSGTLPPFPNTIASQTKVEPPNGLEALRDGVETPPEDVAIDIEAEC